MYLQPCSDNQIVEIHSDLTQSYPLLQVLCWGVRNMQKFQLSAVTSPSIEFECGGHVQESNVIKSTKKNPNFTENILFFDVVSCWVWISMFNEGWDQNIDIRWRN